MKQGVPICRVLRKSGQGLCRLHFRRQDAFCLNRFGLILMLFQVRVANNDWIHLWHFYTSNPLPCRETLDVQENMKCQKNRKCNPSANHSSDCYNRSNNLWIVECVLWGLLEIENCSAETENVSGKVGECQHYRYNKMFVVFFPDACVQKCTVVVLILNASLLSL